ncbi:hypothetical protein CAEBREN_24156 [Caenorhabditis brenneri]|uniref:Uncharacterized protein n=1 Tax=Caenorhabditis brenneri TaxID=135651 RepID=G0NNF9_CAEBE|nr:hypothetical protein CAEBREN_24156 [Caenorhabditis brenneri]
MEVSTPSNIEQELLAEIQVYRDKQKQWEESKRARTNRRGAVFLIAILSVAWFLIVVSALILPSVLPSIHPALFAINAGFLLTGVLLGLYDTVMMWSEKKSIEKSSLDYLQTKVEEDKKGEVLLNQLKQNREMYQQKINKELKASFVLLSILMVAISSVTSSAVPTYKFLAESYAAFSLCFVLFLLSFAAQAYCLNKAGSIQKLEGKQPPVEK